MKQLYFIKAKTLLAFMMQSLLLQNELIEAQKKIIHLQDKVDYLTPENPPDDKVFWHIASGGIMSQEAANSDDLQLVKRFRDWNIDFAKTHIKPYVSPSVYSECLNQMTRGLADHIAQLENEQETAAQGTAPSSPDNRIIQLPLLHG